MILSLRQCSHVTGVIRGWARRVMLLALLMTTIGCDQVSKHLATIHLMGRSRQSYVGDSIRLEYAENTGAFLSLGSGLPVGLRTALFTFGTAIILAACVVAIARRRRLTIPVLGLTLVVAGGLSNLADRVVRGSVVDFLNLGIGSFRTGIFNVADMAIMTGIALALLHRGRRSGSGSNPGERQHAR